MAVLSDVGAHCAVADCARLDFLPFQCDACAATFCISHFRYAAHCCPKKTMGEENRVLPCALCRKAVPLVPGEDPNITWERHRNTGCCGAKGDSAPPRCPAPGCKTALTSSNSLQCPHCRQRVCLKHRFEDLHACVPAPRRLPQINKINSRTPLRAINSTLTRAQSFPTPKRSGANTVPHDGGRRTSAELKRGNVSREAHKPSKVARLPASAAKVIKTLQSGDQRPVTSKTKQVAPKPANHKRAYECASPSQPQVRDKFPQSSSQRAALAVGKSTSAQDSQQSKQNRVLREVAQVKPKTALGDGLTQTSRTDARGHVSAAGRCKLNDSDGVNGSSPANPGIWRCSSCTLDNSSESVVCSACESTRPSLNKKTDKSSWSCSACGMRNASGSVCGTCGSTKQSQSWKNGCLRSSAVNITIDLGD